MKFAGSNREHRVSGDVFRPYLAAAKATFHARAAKLAILAVAGIVLLIVVWPLAVLWIAFFAWRGMQRAKKHGQAVVTSRREAIVTTARRIKP